jgi:prepilin-type N-terminal cleavage/methylation domain-containing protein/prepilin-type processing-associated H-X9-DG protein
MNRRCHGFTLVELMLVVTIVALLFLAALSLFKYGVLRANIKVSSENLRQLVVANLGYASDHGGWYCPAQDERNLTRWHGGRGSTEEEFSPDKGFLSPYFANDKRLETCPLLKETLKGQSSFEDGAGGYGYNAAYIGGRPGNPYSAAALMDVTAPSRTMMFATTALSKEEGLQEYPFAEPYYAADADGVGKLYDLQPSLHFRAGGKAIVAWCDGHVTLEERADKKGDNFYGGDNEKADIGWFGPEEENGYWNPDSRTVIRGTPPAAAE